MRELRKLIQTVAPTDARVLILGKSGTGKELVAGALHHLSQRREAAYIRINCAAIPENLLESELFGHEKGAFTGALKQKPGRVEEADGGTIFLDEIADMSKPLQAKLLRFLEDGSFTRVGGTEELRVNVRLIAATNRDIAEAIADGQFRQDLFHRLNVVDILPPRLCERGNDVLLLANHFLKMFRTAMNKTVDGFAPASQQKLLRHRWPGNVRELRNAIERALILETSNMIMPNSLPDYEQTIDVLTSATLANDLLLEPARPQDEKAAAERALYKLELKEELFKYEKACSGISRKMTLEAIGNAMGFVSKTGKPRHNEVSFFFSPRHPNNVKGKVKAGLVQELAAENSKEWLTVRELRQFKNLLTFKT